MYYPYLLFCVLNYYVRDATHQRNSADGYTLELIGNGLWADFGHKK